MAGMDYGASILRIVVAQMCETVGWNSIHSTPLELLTDVLKRYITELAENTHRYAEQFGHTQPTLHDLGLAFKDMGITTVDLSEYVEYVATIPSQREVPKYPVERESHLNLLKPGSQEVVTRPVHIHEHLPAMHPELEDEDYGVKSAALAVDTTVTESPHVSPPLTSPKANPFKKPGDPVSLESPQIKRVRLTLEEEGRPLREISSVMMTTSGFLSPAREGKLPEARTPTPSIDFLASQSSTISPQTSFGPSSYPTVPPEVKGEKKIKKKPFTEPIRKVDSNETKEKDPTPDTITDDDDSKVKKLVGMKELSKLKALKSLKIMSHSNPNMLSNTLKNLPKIPKFRQNNPSAGPNAVLSMTSKIKKFNSGKLQPHDGPPVPQQKFNPSKSNNSSATSINIDGKLPSEPDRQKLNIFKKISKVKEDKFIDHSEKHEVKDNASARESAANAGRLSSISEVIESVVQRSMKESLEPPVSNAPPSSTAANTLTPVTASHSDNIYSDNDTFIYDSPPGTPRTPEVIMPPMPLKKSETKKRKRDKAKDKKEKFPSFPSSPKIKCEPLENEIIEKPKTPEIETVHDNIPILPTPSPVFPYFPSFPPAPGLIPPPISGLFPPRFNLDKHGALIPQHITPPQLPPSIPPIIPRPEPKPIVAPVASPLSPPVVVNKKHSVPPPPPTPPTPTTPTLPPPVALKVPSPAPVPQPKTETVEKPVVVKEKEKEKTKEEKKKGKEHRKEKKDKIKKKKDKKDKIKNKDKSLKKKEKLRKEKAREKKEKRREEKRREKEREQAAAAAAPEKPATDVTPSGVSVPKITLKLGPQSPQNFPCESSHRKIVIKPVKKPEEMDKEEKKEPERPRDPSPELARISALVTTRPTKPKSQKAAPASASASSVSSPSASKANKAKIHNPPAASAPSAQASSSAATPQVTAPEVAKGKELRKQPKESDPVQEPLPYYYDDEGTQVWICPACGGQDDGSPMIGCDGCDAWYHWVCVGIQVPPESNDWFCRVCIGKKDVTGEKKKKIRKKKL